MTQNYKDPIKSVDLVVTQNYKVVVTQNYKDPIKSVDLLL